MNLLKLYKVMDNFIANIYVCLSKSIDFIFNEDLTLIFIYLLIFFFLCLKGIFVAFFSDINLYNFKSG